MALPTVAIIGRPNAGKSTLFNALTGTRQAIVSDLPGTTRDHVVHEVRDEEMDYLMVDTGGIGGGSMDHDLEEDVSAQSLLAIETADVIVFTVGIREELTKSDYAVIDILRKKRKRHVPVILALTKCDNPDEADLRMPEYYALGIADTIIAVSAVHRIGTDELSARIVELLKLLNFQKRPPREDRDPPRIAIIGKPNVGKSSIINAFMSEPVRGERPRLVSEIAGTTRDPSDTMIRFEGSEYILVDTAGLRKRAKHDSMIEELSNLKSMQAIASADIVVLTLDAKEVVSRQDKRIAAMAIEQGKGLILLLNKSDLLSSEEKKERVSVLRGELPFCDFAPVLHCSAKTRDGLLKIFPLLESVDRNMRRRISSSDLRRWYDTCIQRLPARTFAQGKHLTQAKDIPPTFVLFMRDPRRLQRSHLRFLEKNLRNTFAFEGSPIRWVTKES